MSIRSGLQMRNEDMLLPAADEWRENLEPGLAAYLARSYGRRGSVEEVAWYTFAVLSAPSYRRQFFADPSIDHPRIPFPADAALFTTFADLGAELGRAHLLEGDVNPWVRFVGEGTNVVEDVRSETPLAGSG